MKDGIFNVSQAAKLETPGRIAELQPTKMLKDIASMTSGETGVDFGSGTGVFTIPMAELTGPDGKVFAVDSSEIMHEHLKQKRPPDIITYITADVCSTRLPDGIANICVAGFILHEIRQPQHMVNEAGRLLKEGGRLVIIDWRADTHIIGPPPERRITRNQIEGMISIASLTFIQYLNWTDNHYVVLVRKQEETS